MSSLTTKLKLQKPAGPDPYNLITDINAGFVGIDELCAPTVCTSNTRPVEPFEGQTIWETDKNRWWLYDAGELRWIYLGGSPPYCVVGYNVGGSSPFGPGAHTPVSWQLAVRNTDNIFRPTVDATKLWAPYPGTYFINLALSGYHAHGGSESYVISILDTAGNRSRGSSGFHMSGNYVANMQLEKMIWLDAGAAMIGEIYRYGPFNGELFNEISSQALRMEMVMISSYRQD